MLSLFYQFDCRPANSRNRIVSEENIVSKERVVSNHPISRYRSRNFDYDFRYISCRAVLNEVVFCPTFLIFPFPKNWTLRERAQNLGKGPEQKRLYETLPSCVWYFGKSRQFVQLVIAISNFRMTEKSEKSDNGRPCLEQPLDSILRYRYCSPIVRTNRDKCPY